MVSQLLGEYGSCGVVMKKINFGAGLLALSLAPGSREPASLADALLALEPYETARLVTECATKVWVTGKLAAHSDESGGVSVLLSDTAFADGRPVGHSDIARCLGEKTYAPELDRILPPYAAVYLLPRSEGIRLAADYLGFRHIYYVEGSGWSAASTSAVALALLARADLDRGTLAVQSLLGWQIEGKTLFAGVHKLRPRSALTLRAGGTELTDGSARRHDSPVDLTSAVREAARILRDRVPLYLEAHPDLFLQLTGGLDSRILLAAIPPGARHEVTAMTLSVAGSDDFRIASQLSKRYQMAHRELTLRSIDTIDPAEAHYIACVASRRLNGAADPLAWGALALAEDGIGDVPRLSGLGGEIVRGFYYAGFDGSATVTRRRVIALARWRLTPNDAVPSHVFRSDFARWRHEELIDRLTIVMAEESRDWRTATDEFYIGQRMHRWAGTLASATCLDRAVINPMLDPDFVQLGRDCPSEWKRGMRYLSRILVELDPSLVDLPLDGRPAPSVYAGSGSMRNVQLAALTARKVYGKARQKVTRQNRPPAGGDALAALVVKHWRTHPELLESVHALGVISESWLDAAIVNANLDPTPATVAFLVNLQSAEWARAD